jgi:VWFA-related protein
MAVRSKVVFAIAPLLFSLGITAQQQNEVQGHATQPSQYRLDVVVSNSSGQPVTGLNQQDFTLLDNNAPRPITSFTAMQGGASPVEMLLVIDAVNTPIVDVGYQRDQIEKFLRSNGGHLANPTTYAIVTDRGAGIYNGSTRNGNLLADALHHEQIGLREINRSGGFYGASDRLSLSIKALQDLTAFETKRPGRKLMIWISPGWPLLSGVEVELDNKQQIQTFQQIVAFSAELHNADVTLYDVNSWGVTEPLGRATYYEEFLKGVEKPGQTQLGNLGLQVLAVQSGGLSLSSNDVPGMLQKCLRDANAYYEITFTPGPTDKADEYHQLQVRVTKPGLSARTRQGYYSQPGGTR